MPDNNQIPQIFPEDTSIPPIPSGMAQDTSFPNPIQTITDALPQEGNTPPGLPPIIPSSKPKKKFGGRKMIATILGLFVLIGGIAAGIVLVEQQQDIREKAYGCPNLAPPAPGFCESPGCRYVPNYNSDGCIVGYDCECPPTATPSYHGCGETCNDYVHCIPSLNCPGGPGGGTCVNGLCPEDPDCICAGTPTPTPGIGGCLPRVYFDTVLTDANGDNAGICRPTAKLFDVNQVACDGSRQTCDQYLAQLTIETGVTKVQGGCFENTASCERPGGKTVSFRFFYDTVQKKCISTNHRYDDQNDTDADDINHSSCLNNLRQYQPNAKQICYKSKPSCLEDNSLTPQCLAVKTYDANWNLLTGTQLSALSAGDVVRFTVSGIPANQIDKARFTINGVLGSETTDKKPGTNEYYIEYTIPAGVSSFTVTAQIHHATLGWF